jgi:site-specific DNA-methyltransferase (adenine-specific)
MGSGSTIAAAEAIGYQSIGVEKYKIYYQLACSAIGPLSRVAVERDQLGLGFDR